MRKEHIMMVSGGKDSSALIKYCQDHNIKTDRYIFLDSTLELPCVYTWLDYLENRFNIEIERLRTKKKFKELFYKRVTKGKREGEIRGFPYTIQGCWIGRDLKFRNKKLPNDSIRIIGYCYDEDRKTKEVDYIAPFVDAKISTQNVITYCLRHELYPPNIPYTS